MKRLIVVFLAVMFIASVAEAKMVDNQNEERAIKGIQKISRILNDARNQVGTEVVKLQADIAADPDRYDPNDITALQSLFPYLTTIKNDISAYEGQKDIVFPNMN